MNCETSKNPSLEEMARIEKQRTISDAELLKNGAEYKFDDKGNKRIVDVDTEGKYIDDAKNEAEKTVHLPNQEEQKKEKLEGENLFQYQIENNSHPLSKSLKEDMALFIGTLDKGIASPDDFKFLKEELSELLYRSGIEYVENKEIKIDGENKEILQPILDFRKELDQWKILTESKLADFRKRLIEYMGDVFGIEIQEPREGETFNSKEMQATKVEETKNEFLDNKIKKTSSPGYKINEKILDYYEKWLIEKRQEMKKKWDSIKDNKSSQEFDKIFDEDQAWLKKHTFPKSIKPARVEIYRFKA